MRRSKQSADNILIRISAIKSHLKIDNLANVFTKKSGIEQSTASAIISEVIQYVIQYAASSGTRKGGIQNILAILSNLQDNLTPEHPLIIQVQEKTGLKDKQLVSDYVENALNFISQEADVNPEGIESLFGNTKASVTGDRHRSDNPVEKRKKGLGELIKGFFTSK